MKFSAAILAVVVGSAYAGKPNLSITVKDGSFDGLEGFDPTVTYGGSTTAGDVDLEYGIEATVKPTTDIASLPKSIWGKASTSISGWGVSAKAEIDPKELDSADVTLDASNEELDLSVKVDATAGSEGGLSATSVEATKGIELDSGKLTITPRFNVADDEKDVVVTYSQGESTTVSVTASAESQSIDISHSAGNTDVSITASVDEQEVTISQQIDDDNRVAPTINNKGDLSVEWEKSLGDDNSVTTTLKPNDSINVEWKDGAWTATVDMPLEENSIAGATVSVKRDVDF